MNINDLKTIEQLEQFLTSTQAIAFVVASSKQDICRDIQRTQVIFKYPVLDKVSKGVVVRFLIKITGLMPINRNSIILNTHNIIIGHNV